MDVVPVFRKMRIQHLLCFVTLQLSLLYLLLLLLYDLWLFEVLLDLKTDGFHLLKLVASQRIFDLVRVLVLVEGNLKQFFDFGRVHHPL